MGTSATRRSSMRSSVSTAAAFRASSPMGDDSVVGIPLVPRWEKTAWWHHRPRAVEPRTRLIRVACYGKFAPECARVTYKYGCALEMDDSLYIEDSFPLKNGDFEEGQNSNGNDQEDESTDFVVDSDWEMLALVRELVEKRPDNIMEEFRILSAVAKICLKREGVESSLCFFLKGVAIVEHLVESEDRQIDELPFCICSVLEVAPKIAGSITFSSSLKRDEFVGLCKLHIRNLKNVRENTLKGEMVSLAGRLVELEKKLDELARALSSLVSCSDFFQELDKEALLFDELGIDDYFHIHFNVRFQDNSTA